MLTREDLEREAAATGFQAEPLEKAIRLLELLESLRSHPFLTGRIALKGGTALNLFVFDAPRLSVDVDLNYIGAADRETMLAGRPKVEQAVRAVCGRLGIRVRRVPTEHAGGKWRLSYVGAGGRSGTLELDVNFLMRTPLWPPVLADSRHIGSFIATRVLVLDVHELAAGKLAALFSRSAGRDLFDVRSLLREVELDRERLRLGFVIYGGACRRDWRDVTLDDIPVDLRDMEQQLLPVLRTDLAPRLSEVRSGSEDLVAECRDLLSGLLPLNAPETEFLARLNERGEIAPELLTGDAAMQAIIRSHPGLLWKAENVREHKGLTGRGRGA
jgi:predicted nucleotidyltransferase component of viral defense system